MDLLHYGKLIKTELKFGIINNEHIPYELKLE